MNSSFLTESNWNEFNAIFPDANQFLLKRSLENELGHYQRLANAFGEEKLSPHAQKRMKELRQLGIESREQERVW